ncbi:MAG: hypothetical protein JRF20_01430 [Deltaproteobacteria bacterium]|nr:hypothetical protein [Deltaproteobacteria bacterium]MBW1964333.1 hypothetical protein [Deltaproteobacteria bacterium]MBW2349844.1 hypothetical protein [Deltaproteobacteria bacterium]
MRERRKIPRYSANFRVYFPKLDMWGHTSNISLEGCYVTVDSSMSEGFITDLLVELPVVGVIALKGYVQHLGETNSGAGLQFVQVRFEFDQSDYFSLYSRFLRSISQLEKIRANYLDLVQQDRLKLCTMPSESEKAETN